LTFEFDRLKINTTVNKPIMRGLVRFQTNLKKRPVIRWERRFRGSNGPFCHIADLDAPD
jgi:hypothetical protein